MCAVMLCYCFDLFLVCVLFVVCCVAVCCVIGLSCVYVLLLFSFTLFVMN